MKVLFANPFAHNNFLWGLKKGIKNIIHHYQIIGRVGKIFQCLSAAQETDGQEQIV